ncbi:MAG: VpsF family polysaccharide biosynthesis protein [Pseudomonadota bacterium]|nr:VpsF family polysaccharide biosynthesis protein [Pseudomonadota bacterium]
MSLGLRANEPLVFRARKRSQADRTRFAFPFGVAAVVAIFAIPIDVLDLMGIDYASPGGNPLIKLHPATYLAACGAAFAVFGARRSGDTLASLFRDRPGLAAFLVLIPACAFYSMLSVGFSGSAVYVESFLSAGLLAVALEAGSERQRRALGYLFLAFCLGDVGLSVFESLTQTQLIPIVVDNHLLKDAAEDFRGFALYDHPLTGAMVTAMGVFLVLSMRLGPLMAASAFSLLLIGLLSFGGRTALGVTLLFLVVAAIYVLVHGLATRNLSASFVAAFLGGAAVLAPLLVVIALETTIGERIVGHLYYDSSAAVRNTQWQVLGYLTQRDVLFGIAPDALDQIKAQIGLGSAFTDIENCWLLIFLNLGLIGFVVFLAALVLFLGHLARRSTALGWMVLVATLIMVSSSNSLGRKGPDLFFLVACMIAMTGFIGYERPAAARARVRRVMDLRHHRGLATGPAASSRNITAVPPARPSLSLLAGHSTR